MANVKNFGLIGTGSTLQLGKGGVQIVNSGNTEVFFKDKAQSVDVPVTAADFTASTGNVALTATTGTVSIGGDTTLSRQQAGVFQFNGTAAVVVPVGTLAQRPATSIAGSFRYNSDNSYLEFYNGTTWVDLATGGSTVSQATNLAGGTAGQVPYQSAPGVTAFSGPGTAGQALVSNGTSGPTFQSIVNSFSGGSTGLTPSTASTGAVVLGGILNPASGGTGVNNGTYTITLGGNVSTAGAFTTTTGAVTLVAATGGSNVTLPASGTLATTGNTVASFSGGTTGLAPATATTGAVTLSGTLNIANGGTGATTKQAAFDNLAPTAIAGDLIYFNGTNNVALGIGTAGQALVVTTGEPSWSSIVNSIAGGTGITASSPTGAVTLTLSSNLQSLSGLAGTGFVVQTAANTFAECSITGTAGNIVVTNGDGVAASPTIDLAPITQGTGSNFVKVTLDGYGRVTGNTAVAQGDLTGLLGTYYLPTAGGTMAGAINMGTYGITNLAAPTQSTDAATKAYVDGVASGLNLKSSVVAATTADLGTVTYSNGTSGVGATLTNGGTQAALVVDTYAVAVGDRILVKNQTTATQNGIYVVTTVGSATTNWVLTRASDFDNSVGGEVHAGDFAFVSDGATNKATGWVEQTVGTGTAGAIVIGTDNITFAQFSGAGSYSAGSGLVLTGTTFSVNYGAGIGPVPSGDVGINLFSDTTGALMLTTTGTSRDTSNAGGPSTGSKLALLLPTGSGLAQDTTGLYIPAAGVTNTMLANSTITLDVDNTGTTSVALGGTLSIFGTTNRIVTSSPVAGEVQVDISANYVGQTSITTLGTVTTGTWNGTTIDVAHGGTGLSTAPTNGQLLIGNGTGYTLAGLTAGSGISVTNGAGSITVANTGVLSVSGGTTGLTFTTTSGAATMSGTLATTNGGTGLTAFTANEVFYASSTSAMAQSAGLAFNGTDTLTVGSSTLSAPTAGPVTLTATATNSNINLVPNGTGQVIIGSTGAGTIASGTGESLTVTGTTTLTLASTTGNTTMSLGSAGAYVAVATSDADTTGATYATAIASAPTALVNKYYVDQAIQTVAETGAVKVVSATVPLNANGTTNIGAALPAGAVVLSVKVNVTTADTAATLAVGTSTTAGAFMATTENDPQTNGIYVAETYVVNASSTQVIATVAATGATSGSSCVVIVTYQY